MSIGFGFLMIAVLVPGAGWGSGVCLAIAAAAQVIGLKQRSWTAVSAVFGAAAIGLGSQSAWQSVFAGMAAVIAVMVAYVRVLPAWPDFRRTLIAVGIGGAIGIVAASIPIGARWLALVAPVLVVLLFAAVLAPVARAESSENGLLRR